MKLLFSILLLIPIIVKSQVHDDLDNRINGLTTIVESRFGKDVSQGSGFFYYLFSDDTSKTDNRLIKAIFLVTNKHVIFSKDSNGRDLFPDNITFYFRSFSDSISWSPITIPRSKLIPIVAIHQNPSVDIVIIQVMQYLPKGNKMLDSSNVSKINGVYEDLFPNKNTRRPQVSDDIIVVGYPKGYYDHKNLFPIVKTGIIASKWGANFDNNPYFLIDSKLFPASSGSLVLSKPIDFQVLNGKALTSTKKQYLFLGIYSGELSNKEPQDIGVVWYGNLISEIINNGLIWK